MPSDSLVHATAGAAGGCIAMAITYPLISISTRAQVEAKRHAGESSLEAALKLIRREGVVSLYDGLSSSLIGIAVTNGIYYLFFEESRAFLLKSKKAGANLTTVESMLAGAIAGSATSVISNPIWVVNTRQTVRQRADSTNAPSAAPSSPAKANSKSSEGKRSPPTRRLPAKKLGFIKTVLHILRTDGPAAFFHGLGPALILVINPILQFTLFEQLKNVLIARRSARSLASSSTQNTASALAPPAANPLTDLDFFMLGAVSKLFATGITYPYLTVKSRMQSGQAEGRGYNGTLDGLRKISKKEGLKGLYRGVGPKLTQSVLTAAFLFLAKEKIYVATKRALNTAAQATPVA